jgi:hypothetical protein
LTNTPRSLSRNDLTDVSALELASKLEGKKLALTEIYLYGNQIGDPGGVALSNAMAVIGVKINRLE